MLPYFCGPECPAGSSHRLKKYQSIKALERTAVCENDWPPSVENTTSDGTRAQCLVLHDTNNLKLNSETDHLQLMDVQ